MPNDWFQFKQFTVQQDRCAMKVSTDACIQGAWAAMQLQKQQNAQPLTVLDIGTGTGLLSLMLAQLNPHIIVDAIELNGDAAGQAGANFAASPWSERLRIYHAALTNFRNAYDRNQQYDFIICNPPFFHNQLQAPGKARNEARHSISLSKTELADTAACLLKAAGTLCVLYPAREWDDWEKTAAQHGLYPEKILSIQPNGTAAPNRLTGLFNMANHNLTHQEQLVIYEPDKSYTPAFTNLLQPYYLHL
jgi:tRNA1Val (adenine37-N6)-methyltransferase